MFAKKYVAILLFIVFLLIFILPTKTNTSEKTTSTPQTPTIKKVTITPTAFPTTVPNAPTQTPTPNLHITQTEVKNGFIFLEIPALKINAQIDLATIVETNAGPEFIEPKENPLWIPNWSVNIGSPGLSMIYGHRQWGPVPKVFTDLNLLNIGDRAIISSPNHKLSYTVTNTEVINPQDLWSTAEKYNTQAITENNNQLMLITCTPWGTSLQRLIIILNLEAISEILP